MRPGLRDEPGRLAPARRAWRSAMTAAAACSQASSWLAQSHSHSASPGMRITVGQISPPRVDTRRLISSPSSASPVTASARTSSTPRDHVPDEQAERSASKSSWMASDMAQRHSDGLAQRVFDLTAEHVHPGEGAVG
jgi:hypothetical protein